MTFTVQKKEWSLLKNLLKISQLIKRSLTIIGFLAVAVILILMLNDTLSARAANVVSTWVNNKPSSLDNNIALAPFEFDGAQNFEHSAITIAEGYSKYPVATIAALPILELEELTEEQAKLTNWIANRYRVAPEMVALLVKEAWLVGEQKKIDPTLILAIIANESRFNPYAQSEVGATGLMQVMTRIHADKLERTGGAITVFDPVTNLRVGVQILEEHVKRAGSLEGGLKQYVGATGPTDYGYGKKVLTERDRIRRVIFGRTDLSLETIFAAGKKEPIKTETLPLESV